MNVLKTITSAASVAVFLATAAMPALAAKTTPATDKNSAVPAVPRAIPDLIPYHKFDPPASKLFDISKLTISGDIRVRPEFRTNDRFGLSMDDLRRPFYVDTNRAQDAFTDPVYFRPGETLPAVVAGSDNLDRREFFNGAGESQGTAQAISDQALSNRQTDAEESSAQPGQKRNTFFVQQWIRLGIHYTISPDVVFFFQPQFSKNWGRGENAAADANTTDGTIFARQGYMLLRNFLIPNLTVKAGRQLVVWGNHRMFGHFDWNNVGWSHDGVTTNYKVSDALTLQAGWLRTDETNCGSVTSDGMIRGGVTSGGCGVVNAEGRATSDSDIVYVRAPMKLMGFVIEPTWIWHNGGSGGNINAPRPNEQSRHTLGGRMVKKMPLGGARVDATVEGYYQLGTINNDGEEGGGLPHQAAILESGRNLDISASAFHVDAGLTLPVPMQPRLGAEFNIASGNSSDDEDWGSFDQLYPTNHIHFGYMDRMAWKNMVHYAVGLQLRPTKDSHFEVTGHWFYLNEEEDNWYGANQAAFLISPNGNQEDSLGNEVDVVYTMFLTPGNHVGWQIGGGVFFPGDFVDGNPASSIGNQDISEESWGYTQLWINF